MSKADEKIPVTPLSNEIDTDLKDAYDAMASDLPGSKREILEAMIRVFKALPEELQLRVLSSKPETREAALALVTAIRVTPKRVQRSRGASEGVG